MKDISKTISSNAMMIFPNMDLTLFIKSFQIPSLTLGQTQIPMPQKSHWMVPSIHSTVEQITVMFFCDENYKNYFHLLDWMHKSRFVNDVTDVMTDAHIKILNNHKQPIIDVFLKYCYIVSLGEIDFDVASTDIVMPYATFQCAELSYHYADGSMSGEI